MQLQEVHLGDNQLTGSLPESWSKLTNVRHTCLMLIHKPAVSASAWTFTWTAVQNASSRIHMFDIMPHECLHHGVRWWQCS